MRRVTGAVMLAVAMMAASGVQAAEDRDFIACDGFLAPKGDADNISNTQMLFGLATGAAEFRRIGHVEIGQRGLDSCYRALADPRLLGSMPLRQAHLLQSQAVHAIGQREFSLALHLLDQSDRVGGGVPGPWFARSLGVANQAVRAYALIQADRHDEAREMIAAMRAAGRWSSSIDRLAYALQMQLDGDFSARSTALRGMLPLNPTMAQPLFKSEFIQGNFAAALETYPAITLVAPQSQQNAPNVGLGTIERKNLIERNSLLAMAAYARAALGQGEEARSMIAGALAQIAPSLVPPSARSNGRPARQEDIRRFEMELPTYTQVWTSLEHWQQAVELRIAAGTMGDADLQQAIAAGRLDELPLQADLLGLLAAASPDPAAADGHTQARLAAIDELAQRNFIASQLDLAELARMLPRPETDRTVPSLRRSGVLGEPGVTRDREGRTDIWTIGYGNKLVQVTAAEELAIYAAAETALEQGHDSLLVLTNHAMVRSQSYAAMDDPNMPKPAEYSAQLRVRLVNAAALPADIADQGWRLISARRAVDELQARYRTDAQDS